MKKRILTLPLVLLLVASVFLQGCQKDNDKDTNATTSSVAETAEETTGNTTETTAEESDTTEFTGEETVRHRDLQPLPLVVRYR